MDPGATATATFDCNTAPRPLSYNVDQAFSLDVQAWVPSGINCAFPTFRMAGKVRSISKLWAIWVKSLAVLKSVDHLVNLSFDCGRCNNDPGLKIEREPNDGDDACDVWRG
jgi:hypothetical protein